MTKLSTTSAIVVIREGKFMNAYQDGVNVTKMIPQPMRRKALQKNKSIAYHGQGEFSYIPLASNPTPVMHASNLKAEPTPEVAEPTLSFMVTDIENPVEFIHKSPELKPSDLIISDLKWKYLVRACLRGKNIMMTGPAGSGKTVAAKYLSTVLNRPDFYFNLGATQDPRATLIGNTHFAKDTGTYFSESLFVKAIQTENAVILLDELSRAHPEAWNILMTVLDPQQRYLRLDEADGAPTIKVASGVTFIATANIGSEYTSTRVLDRAIRDRFITIEMDQLNADQEFNLLKLKFPMVKDELIKAVADIAGITRTEISQETPKLSTAISTRISVELASLLADGFTLAEGAEVCIYPFFSADGGADSERVYIKQVVQKYCEAVGTDTADPFAIGNEEQPAKFPF